jgi:coproporphyrinogen III oxidase
VVTTENGFGGGADLNPMLAAYRTETHDDTVAFLTSMAGACAAHDVADFERYKKWCDDYFWLPHRNEPRGVGGIFYDHLNSGDWAADFAFTQDVGKAFLDIFPKLVEARYETPFDADTREAQLIQRGRYVEFNLLYDAARFSA